MHCLVRVAVFAWAAVALLAQKQEPAAQPQYFDPPSFIAAGVTDYTNRGGHGSDAVMRSAEVLAKATASLGSGLPAGASNEAAQHHSRGDAEEKAGNPLQALREYQRAAALEPSEPHIFDLGTDLLKHHAAEQAAEVFTRGAKLFPRSQRMLLGCAAACYSRGLYDQAKQWFFQAADLNPSDPVPYLFLGKAQSSDVTESAGYAERMERFAQLHPDNAWANYYFAVSLSRRDPEDAKARTLLEKAVRLDPQLAPAWLQLGILFAASNDHAKAVATWQNAISADPQMEEAHYRLAQAYRRMGEPAKAKTELALYEQLSKQSAERVERERAASKQFVFTLKKP